MIEQFKIYLEEAVNELYMHDKVLIDRKGMEQACVSRVYYYLQTLINDNNIFDGYYLDCEYNKNGDDPKTCYDVKTGEEFQTRPDMILHQRGNNVGNKVIIEFKGWWNSGYQSDERKLKAFTDQRGIYKYKLGIFVKINKEVPLYKFYRNSSLLSD